MFQNIGYHVSVVNCDQSAVNRKAFTILGVTKENPFFTVDNIKVWGLFDGPHLYKNVSPLT